MKPESRLSQEVFGCLRKLGIPASAIAAVGRRIKCDWQVFSVACLLQAWELKPKYLIPSAMALLKSQPRYEYLRQAKSIIQQLEQRVREEIQSAEDGGASSAIQPGNGASGSRGGSHIAGSGGNPVSRIDRAQHVPSLFEGVFPGDESDVG